jgi:hypothetical protein
VGYDLRLIKQLQRSAGAGLACLVQLPVNEEIKHEILPIPF